MAVSRHISTRHISYAPHFLPGSLVARGFPFFDVTFELQTVVALLAH
jgi:hypothetical protein